MYKTYWGMEFNPFDKEQKGGDYYHGNDFEEVSKRLEHLKNIKGIGLFMGSSGVGKTCAIRNFVECLNKNLYQVIYIQLTTVGVNDFYRDLSISLGLDPCYRKIDNFKQIQNRISTLYREQRVTPVLWIDEAQYLHHSILSDLKMLMNFEMDSRNYAIMILSGLPSISDTLSLRIHEALYQRIVIHYSFQGMMQTQVKEYINSRLELCGVNKSILEKDVYEVIGSYSNGSIRKLDNLMHKALMIGCSKNANMLDRETIMDAISEADLIQVDAKMEYINKEHEKRFYNLMLEDNTDICDKERQSLLYILAGNSDLYQKKNGIYDMENHCIIPTLRKKGVKVDLSGGAKALITLGFNLYNGKKQKENSICDIFWNLDEQNRILVLNAIKIRFM